MILLYAIGFLVLVTSTLSLEIQKCKLPDPRCVRDSAQKMIQHFGDGIPEYNVERMDPFIRDMMSVSSPTLNITLRNIVGTGLKNCKVIRMNVEDLKMSGQSECNFNIEADYEINGKIMVLPISGKGKLHIKIKKMMVNGDANLLEVTGKDGKKHWKMKSFTYSYDIKEKSYIKMDNLFNGNAALSGAINDLFDSSPNEVLMELSPDLVADLTKQLAKDVNYFFEALPIDALTLN